MLKTEAEKLRGYSDETHNLILEMERVNLSKVSLLNKEKCEEVIKEAYRIAELPLDEIIWKENIDDEFITYAGAARAARAAGAAGAAWAAGAARAAGAAGID